MQNVFLDWSTFELCCVVEEVWDGGFMRIWYQWMRRDEDELVVCTWLQVRGISRQLGAGFFSLKDLKCLK